MAGERFNNLVSGSDPSIVLAASATTLYILGRDSTGVAGHWNDLRLVTRIPRRTLRIKRHQQGPVLAIDLTDTTSGATFSFEARLVGNLGVRALLADLDGPAPTATT